jgi:hypothetical protein
MSTAHEEGTYMNKLGRAVVITAIAAGSGLVVAGPASANVPYGCETVIYNTVGKARCTDGVHRTGIADCANQGDIRKPVIGNGNWVYFECRHKIRAINL